MLLLNMPIVPAKGTLFVLFVYYVYFVMCIFVLIFNNKDKMTKIFIFAPLWPKYPPVLTPQNLTVYYCHTTMLSKCLNNIIRFKMVKQNMCSVLKNVSPVIPFNYGQSCDCDIKTVSVIRFNNNCKNNIS